MRRFPIVALTLLGLLATACDGSVGTEQGTFVLRTVGDSTVPFVVSATDADRVTLLADTLTFDGQGNATEIYVLRYEPGGQPPAVVVDTYQRRYAGHGNKIVVMYSCPPNAVCAVAGGETFVMVAGGLRADSGPGAERSMYERIR